MIAPSLSLVLLIFILRSVDVVQCEQQQYSEPACGNQTVPPKRVESDRTRTKRITGPSREITQYSPEGAWRWFALIAAYPNGKESKAIRCGGAIIDRTHVVTAAQCVAQHKPQTDAGINITIRAVSVGTQRASEVEPGLKNQNVTEVHVPKSYNLSTNPADIAKTSLVNSDIAVLTVNKPFTFGDKIQPICLPAPSDELDGNSECYVAGWGLMDPFPSENARHPVWLAQMKAEVKSGPGYGRCEGGADSETVCVKGVDGRHLSKGDVGDPLMCKRASDNAWVLHGIASIPQATAPSIPASEGNRGFEGALDIFTNVAAHVNWIKKLTD